MTDLLIRRRIKHHKKAAAATKHTDRAAYWQHRREMLLAQGELYELRNAQQLAKEKDYGIAG